MNTATDTYGIVYLIDLPASVGVRSCGQCSMSLRNAYTQARNVQTQTQSTVTIGAHAQEGYSSLCVCLSVCVSRYALPGYLVRLHVESKVPSDSARTF